MLSLPCWLWTALRHLVQTSLNSPRSLEGFRWTLRQNFNYIRKQMKNFPIDPHCKNCPRSAMSLCCRMRAIFTMGTGEILYPLSELNEYCLRVRVSNLQMIEVSLSLIERDVTKISSKIRFHWNVRRTVHTYLLPAVEWLWKMMSRKKICVM